MRRAKPIAFDMPLPLARRTKQKLQPQELGVSAFRPAADEPDHGTAWVWGDAHMQARLLTASARPDGS